MSDKTHPQKIYHCCAHCWFKLMTYFKLKEMSYHSSQCTCYCSEFSNITMNYHDFANNDICTPIISIYLFNILFSFDISHPIRSLTIHIYHITLFFFNSSLSRDVK